MKEQGIIFAREPIEEVWGTVAVFKDLYGNLWDLIEPQKNLSSDPLTRQDQRDNG